MSEEPNIQFNWPILGHRNVVNFLQKSLTTKQLSQAYIFYGPSHIGKTTVAKYFIKSILCEHSGAFDKAVPCEDCSCCRQIEAGTHPDFFEVDIERDKKTEKLNKNISIEQIKGMQSRLNHCSFLNSYKIALIHGAEFLSEKAHNALLKTLEEPSAKSIIIMLTDEFESLPKTVVSRCQSVQFLRVGSNEIKKFLLERGVEQKEADELTRLAGGQVGAAINFLEEPERLENYKKAAEEFIEIFQKGINERFLFAEQILDNRKKSFYQRDNLAELLNIWNGIIRDILLHKSEGEHLIKNKQFSFNIKEMAERYSVDYLAGVLENIKQAKNFLADNVNPKLILENLILNI